MPLVGKKYLIVAGTAWTLLFTGCHPTRYLPENNYLLSDNKIKIDSRQLSKKDINGFLRQQPNKRVLGFRFHLWLYNQSNPAKNNGINRWLRQIGEAPVLWDAYQTDRSVQQIGLYMRNKGYYHAKIDHEIFFHKREVDITYSIKTGKPFLIKAVNYQFEDTTLSPLVLKDTINSLIKRGAPFDVDVLQNERQRIETFLKNRGYYNFTKDYVGFEADTLGDADKVSLTLQIHKYMETNNKGSLVSRFHPQYRVRNVLIHSESKHHSVDSTMIASSGSDTLSIDSLYFIYPRSFTIRPKTISQAVFIQPNRLFNQSNVDQTYLHLSTLKVFRFTDLQFSEVRPLGDEPGKRWVDCNLFLYPQVMQSYAVELEGTNSSGNIGVAGNVSYQHKNLFGGAEVFDIRLKGAVETFSRQFSTGFKNTLEFGLETSVSIPKFWLPFRTSQFVKKYSPKTSITAAYNYQRRPDYTRTIANASFGYTWQGNRYNTFIVNPVELNAVKIFSIDQDFLNSIKGKPYLENSYHDHFVSVSTFTFIFNNQNIRKKESFVYLRTSFESAGNLLSAYNDIAGTRGIYEGTDTLKKVYSLFGTQYSQFLRSEVDVRYNQLLNQTDWMVYRVYAGAGLPYGNSTSLPFEKKFFSGGSNSIRAWQARTLGPGTYKDTISTYPNSLADIKLEANVEYRFKLFWILEGALFADAGNIWAIRKSDERSGALFRWNHFINEVAIGTGIGMRFDFSFFIFRLDLGMKTRNPSLPPGQRWTFFNKLPSTSDFAINVGIGYPF